MKYTKITPFEKHLEEALPEHPSEFYFIFMEDPFERRFLASRVATHLALPQMVCEGENFLDVLESPSLFTEKKVMICDEPKEKEIPHAREFILVITGKTPPPFYKGKEKEGVTLDLREEKPWDKKNRLKQWLQEIARASGKTLSMEGADYFLEFSQFGFSQLIQELEKAMIFAGKEKALTLQIIKETSSLEPIQNGWEISEAVVWGGSFNPDDIDLHGLASQLRYQLQLGLQIAEGKEGLKIPSKKRDKIEGMKLKPSYYLTALKELFDLEMKMRSNICNQNLLFDRFCFKLSEARHE